MLRVVNEPWPCPPNYPLAPRPLGAFDLLEYPIPKDFRLGGPVVGLGHQPGVEHLLERRQLRHRVAEGKTSSIESVP